MRNLLTTTLAVVFTFASLPAIARDCRLALALGLDVSGSVNSAEYVLQRRGVAAALSNPDVAAALLALPQAPVDLLVYEWSGPNSHRILLDWTPLTDERALARATLRIAQTDRAGLPPSTALGSAMLYGITRLQQRPHCWQHTLDISGDGKSNTGPLPGPLRTRADVANITINALVIGAEAAAAGDARYFEIGELVAYFRAYVITGPGAFVETALGFGAYESAMTIKLLREATNLTLSRR